MSPDDVRAASDDLVARIRPLLAGVDPGIQGFALADLVAIWLIGHRGDNALKTKLVRIGLIAEHLTAVSSLIDLYEEVVAKEKKDLH